MNRREFIMAGGAVAGTELVNSTQAAAGGAKKAALLGGTPVLSPVMQSEAAHIFDWPIVNRAMREASDKVLANRKMSGTDIAQDFEAKFAA